MLMKEHGLRIFAGGFVLHSDGRRRAWSEDGVEEIAKRVGPMDATRGSVKAFSTASRKRLELIAASAANEFRSLLTLTYHARSGAWEDAPERNARVVRRSKRDLNRFLSSMRRLLGAYVWIQEFQERGVVHYHVMCEGDLEEARAVVAWCRATDALDDAAALRYAVKVEAIRGERAARHYLGRYLGKARQKLLPLGVEFSGQSFSASWAPSIRLNLVDSFRPVALLNAGQPALSRSPSRRRAGRGSGRARTTNPLRLDVSQ